jgi:hypothetical protein
MDAREKAYWRRRLCQLNRKKRGAWCLKEFESVASRSALLTGAAQGVGSDKTLLFAHVNNVEDIMGDTKHPGIQEALKRAQASLDGYGQTATEKAKNANYLATQLAKSAPKPRDIKTRWINIYWI